MVVKGTDGMLYEAERFVRSLSPRADGATVVALSGDLGAGKTAFVKGVARALGVTEHVTSPTFVIMKIYPVQGEFKRLVHIDAYRLKGEHHLKVLGWEELVRDPKNLIFVEWPEEAGAAIPKTAVRIAFRYTGDDERTISYEGLFQEAGETVGTA
jgi:tRNA threonylcarbamoyladenosine biosynthesis protein TsaE